MTLTEEAIGPSAHAALPSPLPSARCRVWAGVWPAAPCLPSSGCGKVRGPAFALSALAAETPELLCLELEKWPEGERGEQFSKSYFPRKVASEETT